MKVRHFLTFFVISIMLAGCMTAPKPTMTPLEIQGFQSREYESAKEVVFPSIISVFQDVGYTITNADIQTGIIFAESSASSDSLSRLFGLTQVSQTKATAFIEQIGTKTRARLSFVEINQTSSSSGQTNRQDTPILDSKFYENAFEKIETAIFVRSAN